MLTRAVLTVARRQSRTVVAAAALCSRKFSGATESFIVPPPERPGLDIKLNWSLAGDDITPYGDAYRNADSGVLGKSSKSKPASSGDVKILEAGDTVSFDTFDEHLDDIKKNLEKSDLYVEDGTAKSGGFGVRVITDSTAYALAAKQLLDQGKVGWPFAKAVTMYVSSTAKDFTGVSFEGGDKGITGGVVAFGGSKVPLTSIKSALTLISQAIAEKK